MRTNDIAFLICVALAAATFAARSVSEAIPLLPWSGASAAAPTGAAGQARDVDMDRLLRLLDQGALSRHEAEFYRPVQIPVRFGEESQGERLRP